MSHLLIFVDSERPDVYLNSVVHNITRGLVQEITFVHVSGFQSIDSVAGASGVASRLLASVRKSIELLATTSTYSFHNGKAVVLDNSNGTYSTEEVCTFYQRFENSSISYHATEIPYQELRKYVRTFISKNSSYILDITGCRKRFLGDFVALGLVDHLDNIHTFDVIQPIDYSRPWKSIYHELSRTPHPSFQYINLLQTKVFSDCRRVVLVRTPRYRHAYTATFALIVIGIGLNAYFGLDSNIGKWANVIAQFATIAALLLIFFPPRDA